METKSLPKSGKLAIRIGDLYGPVCKRLRKRNQTISEYVQQLIATDLGLSIEVKRGRPKGKSV